MQWVEFQFGPPMLKAIGANAIDLGAVGDAPPIFAQAGGADLVYAGKSWSAAFARTRFTFGPVTDAQVEQQQQLADTFVMMGIVARRIDVRNFVWRAPANY